MKNGILAFYPETNKSNCLTDVKIIINYLMTIREIDWVVIQPQTDMMSLQFINILSMLNKPALLERSNYIELLKTSDFIIGNSSSLVLEAPAFKIPSILVGSRQIHGRLGRMIMAVLA